MLLPKCLKKGATIGIYSPSGAFATVPFKKDLYLLGIQALIEMGYKVKEAKNTCSNFYHMSATAQEKANDIHSLFLDDEVDALIPSIGGHTASQILPYLDLAIIKSHPKLFIGFSDSSLLSAYITDRTGLITFHSAVDVTFGFSRFYKEECPMKNKGIFTSKNFFSTLETFNHNSERFSEWGILNNGEAHGTILGGNLVGLQSLIGTKYEPNWSEKILYMETGDQPHRIAQIFSHFFNAGVFNKIKGLIIGKTSHLKESFYGPDEIMPVKKMIPYLLDKINIPIIIDTDLGHDVENITFINGSYANLLVTDDKISFEMKV